MIETKNLFKFLKKEKIDFFTGVPDSVLKTASSFFESKKEKHFLIQIKKCFFGRIKTKEV